MPESAIWFTPLAVVAVTALFSGQGLGAGLTVPANARLVATERQNPGKIELPVSPWQAGITQVVTVEGNVSQQAWQINAVGLTTLQLLAPLRGQLEESGFDIQFECASRACGGFEFRYALSVIAAPAMHVDLGDYRYLTAQRKEPNSVETTSLLVSRTAGRGFIQITEIVPSGQVGAEASATGDPVAVTSAGPAAVRQNAASATVPEGSLAERLQSSGRAVLSGLSFRTGSAELADAVFPSLSAVAAFLNANPEARVVLVGHSDAEGSLEGNVALSRKRAAAVAQRLQERHGIAAQRMQAEGVGYLAPLTSNATAEGRLLNRRVEVVLSEGG